MADANRITAEHALSFSAAGDGLAQELIPTGGIDSPRGGVRLVITNTSTGGGAVRLQRVGATAGIPIAADGEPREMPGVWDPSPGLHELVGDEGATCVVAFIGSGAW